MCNEFGGLIILVITYFTFVGILPKIDFKVISGLRTNIHASLSDIRYEFVVEIAND